MRNRTQVAFRVDASPEIGLGHLSRCLALAHALRVLDAEIAFVVRNLGIDVSDRIRKAGCRLLMLPAPPVSLPAFTWPACPRHAAWAGVPWNLDAEQTIAALDGFDAAWIVVDHYAFDAQWHRAVSNATRAKICLIDDLADRPLAANIVVDASLADHRAKFAPTIRGSARLLGGPRYALLGPAYMAAPRYRFRERVQSIGIFFGGSDPLRLSERALRACRQVARFDGLIEVVSTRANQALGELSQICEHFAPVRLSVDLPDLTEFYARHDLHVGAGGGAMWERCFIGSPTVALAFAENQRQMIEGLAAVGAIEAVKAVEEEHLGQAVRKLIDDAQERRRLSAQARTLVDGLGAKRVALALLAESIELAPASSVDAEFVFRWRNDARTRRFFRDPSPITRETHDRWWSSALAEPSRTLLVARCASTAVGIVRLDRRSDDSAEVSIYLDPELTGLGLGPAALRALQRWVAVNSNLAVLSAHVLPENRASMRAFEEAGFVRRGDTEWTWNRNVV